MAKSQSNFNKQLTSLGPDALVDLYEIDFSNLQADFEALRDMEGINLSSEPVYRFCPMINSTNPIVWQGKSYQPLPMAIEGFEHKSDGRLPRPKLKIGNPEGLLSMIVHVNHDFANCKVTRKRTYVRFLDDENFGNRNLNDSGKNPFGESDPDSSYPDDVYFINRKTAENKNLLEFELVSALELEGAEVPARIVLSGYCPWKYRCSVGCGYKGMPIENSDKLDLTSFNEGPAAATKYDQGGLPNFPEWKHYGKTGDSSTPRGYDKGDVVKISPVHETDPAPLVFVCILDHSLAKEHHPLFDRKVWALDECRKTVDSCKLRFGARNDHNKSTVGGLPFGGFPSTQRYEFDRV